jgi:hypothetical protein
MAALVAAVVVADVVEVGATDARRRERRMSLLLASLAGWASLVLEDMSVDGEDMAGEVAAHVGVVVLVVVLVLVLVGAVEEEVRRRLFRLVGEWFVYEIEPCTLWFGSGSKRRRNDPRRSLQSPMRGILNVAVSISSMTPTS